LCVLRNSQNKQRLLTHTELIDWALKRKTNDFIWDKKLLGDIWMKFFEDIWMKFKLQGVYRLQ